MAQVPLAWDSPLPVFWEEWVRGQPCHSALLHHLQQPKGPGMGSATRGVAPVHPEPLCLRPTGHVHSGVGRDTRVYRWEGTYKRARLGTAVCSHQEACCPCWVQEGPVPAKHRYSWTLRKRAAVRLGTKEATSQLDGFQWSLKLLCLWPHLRPARSHGGAHD